MVPLLRAAFDYIITGNKGFYITIGNINFYPFFVAINPLVFGGRELW
jgi:hypothetical protein